MLSELDETEEVPRELLDALDLILEEFTVFYRTNRTAIMALVKQQQQQANDNAVSWFCFCRWSQGFLIRFFFVFRSCRKRCVLRPWLKSSKSSRYQPLALQRPFLRLLLRQQQQRHPTSSNSRRCWWKHVLQVRQLVQSFARSSPNNY